MTHAQEQAISAYRQKFDKNVSDYETQGSKDTCVFNVYGPDEESHYILGISSVVGMQDFQLLTQITFIRIGPDGNCVSLSELYPQSQIIAYIERLKKA